MKPYLRCFLLLLSALLPLGAQEEPGEDRKRESGRLAWFVHTALPEGVGNPIKVLGGGIITEVHLDQYMASEPVKIPADGILRIIREVADPGSPGKQKHHILGEAMIPDGVGKALIILIPLAKTEGHRVFEAGIQDLASFKGGDRLYINLSDTNIGVKIGDSAVAVPARKTSIYSSPKLTEPANMPIVYNYYHPEKREWKLLTASTVVVMPTRREICIFSNGHRPGKVARHKIIFPVGIETP